MAHLTLAGLSDDGARLLLVDDQGAEFTLNVDSALRGALRGEHARLGQLEIHMDASLRPRDIQARIRAGETPEAVAQAASTTVDKIMPFASPVLAERAHVADRAQRASIRRTGGEGGARVLADAVTGRLVPLNVSSDSLEWDAWRREDGKWTLVAAFATSARKGSASFTFDAPGNYVTADNPDAHWLIGDEVDKPRPATRKAQQPSRRLSAVPAEDELPLGEDALEMVHDDEPQPEATPEVPQEAEAGSALAEDSPFLARAFDRQNEPAAEPEAQAEDQPEPETQPEPEMKRPARKKGRASVPSWDEIMFGGKD